MTNKPAFDDKAHSIVTALLDATEDKMVRRKLSEPQSANDLLCSEYIKSCSGMVFGSTCYLESDERTGTELFLERLDGGRTRLRSPRVMRRCAEQIVRFPQTYFPKYLTVLRISYLDAINTIDIAALIKLSGIVKLAAAVLPNVRCDIRRELRRRGQAYESLIVHDDTLERKLSRFEAPILPMMLDRDSG